MGDAIWDLLLFTAVAFAGFLWFRAVYAMFKAGANRQPGASRFTAMNSMILLFGRRDLRVYTEEGQKWADVYARCVIGFVLVVAGVFALGAIVGRVPTD